SGRGRPLDRRGNQQDSCRRHRHARGCRLEARSCCRRTRRHHPASFPGQPLGQPLGRLIMLARFFIDRPIFAWVIAIVIRVAGSAAITSLPVAQYPDVAPPTIAISATYVGASAETVENSVTQIIEQQLTGLDGMLYFSSSS